MTSIPNVDVSQVVTAFARVAAIARKACEQFGNAIYGIAREQYAHEVGRLPGSDRTARLRRKRRRIVMEWFNTKLEAVSQR